MEGYTYAAPRKAKAAAGTGSGGQQPAADFESTPPAQLGIVPRAVQELFALISADRTTRYSVK